MDFGLSQEISKDVSKKANTITHLSKSLEKHFKGKEYGSGIKNYTIGIICVGPEFDDFFKERKKYTKSRKMLEYDVKLNHMVFKESSEIEIRNMVREKILNSLYIIEDLKVPKFDIESFKIDLEQFFEEPGLL